MYFGYGIKNSLLEADQSTTAQKEDASSSATATVRPNGGCQPGSVSQTIELKIPQSKYPETRNKTKPTPPPIPPRPTRQATLSYKSSLSQQQDSFESKHQWETFD